MNFFTGIERHSTIAPHARRMGALVLRIGVKDPINPKEILGVSNPANQYLPAYGPFVRMKDILVDTLGYINVLRYTGPIKN